MIIISLLFLVAFFVLSIRFCNRIFKDNFENKSHLFLITSFFLLQVFSGCIFRLFLPKVPDDAMFGSIINNRVLDVSHASNFDIVSFWLFSYLPSFFLDGNLFFYQIFQKIVVSSSVLLLFIGVARSFPRGFVKINNVFLFICIICVYPSFFVHYNNILRETFELLFFSLFVFFVSYHKIVVSLFFFTALVSIRGDSVFYFPFIFSYLSLKKLRFKGSQSDYLIISALIAYFLVLLSPYAYDFFHVRRLAKSDFFMGLGIPESDLFESFPGLEYMSSLKFYIYSIVQYLLDPISVRSFSGSAFLWLESFFSIMIWFVVIIVSLLQKKINRIIVVCFCVVVIQSLVEYYIQGGMRHRLLPYLMILIVLSIKINFLSKKGMMKNCV
ncbi:MAG: hypothetical protein ACRDAP_12295 [Shewanella sp.]